MPVATLTARQLEALEKLRPYLDLSRVPATLLHNPTITEFAASDYYIPSDPPSTISLIRHQPIVLEMALNPQNEFITILFTTIKKSGKTALAGLVARYLSQFSGPYAEVFCMANDKEQAKGRIYEAATNSIELNPTYDHQHRTLPNQWHLTDALAEHLPTHSRMKAVPIDYKGEAGSNPTATLWSEVWGLSTKAQKRMWSEMTPVPTRRSIRWVETYAGHTGESDILQGLWNTATLEEQGAERLTRQTLLDRYGYEWPYSEEWDPELPLYVNKSANMFAYVDQGPSARRMPWQTEAYYQTQSKSLDAQEYLRLHENEWISAVSEFVPIEWWKACYDSSLPPINSNEPIVLAGDASVDHDGTALAVVTRHPHHPTKLALRAIHLWKPSKAHPIDYSQTIEAQIRHYASNYNVIQFAYDPYQLHDMATRLSREFVCWCKPFGQMGQRLEADKALQDRIRDRNLLHNGDQVMTDAMQSCAAKRVINDNSKLRIIKKSPEVLIDAAVATSMGCYVCQKLNLE